MTWGQIFVPITAPHSLSLSPLPAHSRIFSYMLSLHLSPRVVLVPTPYCRIVEGDWLCCWLLALLYPLTLRAVSLSASLYNALHSSPSAPCGVDHRSNSACHLAWLPAVHAWVNSCLTTRADIYRKASKSAASWLYNCVVLLRG